MSTEKQPRRSRQTATAQVPQHDFEPDASSEQAANGAVADLMAELRNTGRGTGRDDEDDYTDETSEDEEFAGGDVDEDPAEDPEDEEISAQEIVRSTHAPRRRDAVPQRRTPADDDDEEADARQPEREAVDNVARPRRGYQASVEEVDPVMVAAATAKKLIQGEYEEKEARRRQAEVPRDKHGRRLPDETRKRRPTRAFTRRRKPDLSIPVDSKGNKVEFPGKVLRWVREEDHEGRPVQTRVNDHLEYGWEVPLDPYTKKPFRSGLGVLMVGSPRAAAERSIDYMPTGALNREELLEDTDAAMEEVNRRADDEVCRLHVSRGHKMHRTAGQINDRFREDDNLR